MSNPWQLIDFATYENHMSSDEVYQLQTLNEITKEQLQDNQRTFVGVLGVAGGNGLNNIDILKTQKVYAVDINKNYLDICKQRYQYLGNTLEILCGDLTDADVILPYTNLLICNLIIEYIGEKEFISIIDRNKINIDVVSCVIQKNNDNSFVSNSDLNSHFQPILSIHHNIDENRLNYLFSTIEFTCIKNKKYKLPNGKEFIRMDFRH
ncbi:class I SAM-dependent methyltransferase [Clostridium sp. FP2]|uniref:class I SAM-dependent methyltransferase n=1 Tax=Clostridium sp. FP2 TaxID=2724481 RepID=UPI0013E8F5B6|nr:class I SAM-dependent methyltransferase [Clostridium sp. FP2]MBZ9623799.1 class I SAM-dependent methyltransferase [Clostridium sp. FP2]